MDLGRAARAIQVDFRAIRGCAATRGNRRSVDNGRNGGPDAAHRLLGEAPGLRRRLPCHRVPLRRCARAPAVRWNSDLGVPFAIVSTCYFRSTFWRPRYIRRVYTLQVWKELFRHPRLDDSIAGIAPILESELGVGGVIVRQLDLKARTWTTTAKSQAGTWHAFPPSRSKCKPEQVDSLLAWYGSKEIVRGRPRNSARPGAC